MWPRANPEAPLVQARFKAVPGDFEVDELAAYEPAGEGDHVLFRIEKTGFSTPQAVQIVARALDVPARSIGFAGRKDARGVTRQWLSVEHVDPERVRALELPRLQVLSAERHPHKLRLGHLRGNRFRIRLRDVSDAGYDVLYARLAELELRGVPNYYGEQRFGARGDTWRLGRALLRGDYAQAAQLIAGSPSEQDRGVVREARAAFDAGDLRRAAKLWPGHFTECVRLCRALARTGDVEKAVRAVDRRQLRFYVSAYQAWCFNHVLAERIADFDRLREGDLACVHGGARVFAVEDTERDRERARCGEICATGPMWGAKMPLPGDAIRELEEGVLARLGDRPRDFEIGAPLGPRGARRGLRAWLREPTLERGSDEHGAYVELGFALAPGCYATAVLAEWAGEHGPV